MISNVKFLAHAHQHHSYAFNIAVGGALWRNHGEYCETLVDHYRYIQTLIRLTISNPSNCRLIRLTISKPSNFLSNTCVSYLCYFRGVVIIFQLMETVYRMLHGATFLAKAFRYARSLIFDPYERLYSPFIWITSFFHYEITT